MDMYLHLCFSLMYTIVKLISISIYKNTMILYVQPHNLSL